MIHDCLFLTVICTWMSIAIDHYRAKRWLVYWPSVTVLLYWYSKEETIWSGHLLYQCNEPNRQQPVQQLSHCLAVGILLTGRVNDRRRNFWRASSSSCSRRFTSRLSTCAFFRTCVRRCSPICRTRTSRWRSTWNNTTWTSTRAASRSSLIQHDVPKSN